MESSSSEEDSSHDKSRSLHQERADRFRLNFTGLLRRRSLSVEQFCATTQLPRKAVNRWLHRGANRLETGTLTKLSTYFSIDPPSAWFKTDLLRENGPTHVNPIDLQTNPAIARVRQEKPELFYNFTQAEWQEIYSLRGTGGELTTEGVEISAIWIAEKREARRKFEALLETSKRESLMLIIDAFYKETEIPLQHQNLKSPPFPTVQG
jgi:hypothetical protein